MTERSQNGWPASKDKAALGVVPLIVNGVSFVGGVKGGDVAEVLGYFWTQFDKRVERLVNPGCWGYYYKPNANSPTELSNHSSATATDGNAPKHPNGVPTAKTFSPAQIAEVHEILAELGGVVRWGGDYRVTPDAMHAEINASAAAVAAVAARLRKNAKHRRLSVISFNMHETDDLESLHNLINRWRTRGLGRLKKRPAPDVICLQEARFALDDLADMGRYRAVIIKSDGEASRELVILVHRRNPLLGQSYVHAADSEGHKQPSAHDRGIMTAVVEHRGTPYAVINTHMGFTPTQVHDHMVKLREHLDLFDPSPTFVAGDFNAAADRGEALLLRRKFQVNRHDVDIVAASVKFKGSRIRKSVTGSDHDAVTARTRRNA